MPMQVFQCPCLPQVECDVCRSCTVQAAGCEVHAVAKDPYDCHFGELVGEVSCTNTEL